MTENHAVRRFAERAMSLHRMTPKALSQAIQCNEKTIYKLLSEENVRMEQSQFLTLLILANAIDFKCGGNQNDGSTTHQAKA